ncbi:chromo domain-containing protein 1 [Lepidopterella palustris CBS 459.81]|uniref:Chromo domain-containing protein 1 n=1 Tax=Lepidopterella palustris CBS 459.81 TaxID=1314670 RepID=A0A8E2ELE5_9PEZI|nr:chromo domain-containing protein 1 [Lepidopterella palustris CBS 459.81]
MDSGSILMPSPPDISPSFPLTNGHLSPLAVNVTNADDMSSRSESELTDLKDPTAEDISSEEEPQANSYDVAVVDGELSRSSEDEDADGEVDGDYDSETPPPAQLDASRTRSSTSQESRRPPKRKASVEDDEFITQNPELYGLRRSGRARTNRRIVESTDDEEDSSSVIRRKRQKTSSSRKASHQATPTLRSSPESGSESDTYVGARRNLPTKKQRQRQLQVAAGLLPPSRGEIRFSQRRTKQITNYNEDDDEDMFEEDESELTTPNYWGTTEDYGPAIDTILDHRPKESVEIDPWNPHKKDFDYFIKWQGKAYYHATWETYESIAAYRGFRKIENYFRGQIITEMRFHAQREDDPEEYEKYQLEREKARDALVDYRQVERVIGSRSGDEETEYFVKWKALTYEYCTWETATLVSSLSQTEIDRFLDRSSRLPSSDSKETNLATRRKYVKMEEQPSYIKFGELRSFQLYGVNFLAHSWCRGDNVILADEMGLGKTVQTIAFMNWLRHDRRQEGPFLCVVPLSTIPAWADTFNNWTPDINYVVYTGNKEARGIIRDYEMLADGNIRKVKFNVLLTTYEFVMQDYQFLQQLKWQFLAVDEAHRLKNRESQLYGKLQDFKIPARLFITGTPIQNTLGELSALMDFLMPGKIDLDEEIDLQSEDASRKIAELSAAIKPFMIRRTKEKVENDLPPKSEKILRVELSDIQLEYYKNILTRNYEALNDGVKGQKQSLLNIMMELKKASNHPLIFPNAEAKILKENATKDETLKALITTSGKMMLLDRLLAKLKKDGHRVLIFSQMVQMLNILTDYLRLRNYSFQRLDGTVPAPARRTAIDHFNAPGSDDFCFLLSTRAGGLGINLMTADTVILFDSDWNPQADLQAMARAHRIGQKNPVSIYRLVSKDTVEEEILERARNKLMLEFITIHRGVTEAENKELSDKITNIKKANDEPTSADEINRILKRRGQKMFEQSGNQKKLEELDIDAVLENAEEHKTEQAPGLTSDGGEDFLKSFEYTDVKIDLEWDDIIPKNELDAIKAEVQKKKEEEETRKLLEENAPRKRKAPNSDEREQRAAKKRAREAAREVADDGSNSADDSSTDNDPKRPLQSKEIRNLIRAYEKFGSIEDRGEEIIREAKLVGRDIDLLKATLNEVISESQRLLKEEQARLETMTKEAKKALTKKDKKAVLFDYKDVKRLNAETIVERPVEMRMIKQATEAAADWKNFRVPDAIKPANYSCPWGAREDGMLCVGIARHGYGSWVAIRDDAELGMTDKFFLEEHRVDKKEERSKGEDKNAKSPGAVHLVRRANYLLTVLKEKTGTDPDAKRLIENHHRNNKKHIGTSRRPDKSTSVSASPAPTNGMRKPARDPEKPRMRAPSNSENRHSESRGENRNHDHGALDHRHRQGDHRRGEHRSSVDRRLPPSDRTGTPDVKRTISGLRGGEENGEGERKLVKSEEHPPKYRTSEERPHHPQHHHHRSIDSTSNGVQSQNRDEYAEKKLRPIRDHLDRLKKATGKNIPNKENLLRVLKLELIAVGNFVRAEARDQPTLESRLW